MVTLPAMPGFGGGAAPNVNIATPDWGRGADGVKGDGEEAGAAALAATLPPKANPFWPGRPGLATAGDAGWLLPKPNGLLVDVAVVGVKLNPAG